MLATCVNMILAYVDTCENNFTTTVLDTYLMLYKFSLTECPDFKLQIDERLSFCIPEWHILY